MSKHRFRYHEQPIPRFWWTRSWKYIFYMLREVTGFFAVAYSFILVYQLYQAYLGKDSYESFANLIVSPQFTLITMTILAFMLLHSVTWFMALSYVKLGKFKLSKETMLVGWIVIWVISSWIIYIMFFGETSSLTFYLRR